MRKNLAIIGTAICLCAVALGVVIFVGSPERLGSKVRRQWKDDAIVQIAKQTSDSAAIFKEIKAMKTTPLESEWDTWISEDLIVMTNGQWIAYRSVCEKEEERIPDLFLGLGSDGRWYYSTFHFCVRMINLKDVMGQPKSLTEFSNRAYASSDCVESDPRVPDATRHIAVFTRASTAFPRQVREGSCSTPNPRRTRRSFSEVGGRSSRL